MLTKEIDVHVLQNKDEKGTIMKTQNADGSEPWPTLTMSLLIGYMKLLTMAYIICMLSIMNLSCGITVG